MSRVEDYEIAEGFYGMPSLMRYEGTGVDALIPEEVWDIEACAFLNCAELETVTLPKGLYAIREKAFSGCKKLRRVIFPEKPQHWIEIESGAFVDCPLLEKNNPFIIVNGELAAYLGHAAKVTIPEGVREIRKGVFQDNPCLESVILPDSLELIGEDAFRDCTFLKRINFPKSLREIGVEAFSGSALQSAILPEGLKKLGNRAFFCCEELTYVRLPQSLTVIPENCFTWCNKLERMNLPPALAEIGNEAFSYCFVLALAELPSGLCRIGECALKACGWERVPYLLLPEHLTEVGDWFGRDGYPIPPLIAPYLPLAAFPEPYRLHALKGLAVSRTLGIGIHYSEQMEREYFAYARAHRQELLTETMRDEALLNLLTEELVLHLM